MPVFETLSTQRISLRIPDPNEAKLIAGYYEKNKAHLAPWEPIRSEGFYSEAYWKNFISCAREDFANDLSVKLVIFKETSPTRTTQAQVIGMINFVNIERGAFQSARLGYSIDADFEGKGYMKESLRCALDYMFQQRKLHRIEANYLVSNERSGGLLKSLGFQVNGKEKAYLKINGKWQDHYLSSLTNDMHTD